MEREIPRDDEMLLAEIARGDHHAFRMLFDRYQHRVYSYSIKFLRSEALAEEIVQEVFIKIWLGRAQLGDIGNFGGYLRVVTKNTTLNALKKLALDFKLNNIQPNNWTEADHYTEQQIQLKETHTLLSEALLKLPKQQRLVYQMCQIDGMKQKEVAKQLNISPLTVKAHLREANKTIRFIMGTHSNLAVLLFVFAHLMK